MDFDPYSLFWGFIFGLIGFAAWRYGKQRASDRHILLALLLMGFSYFFSNSWVIVLIGTLLTVLLFWP